jgi:hypothetical protein
MAVFPLYAVSIIPSSRLVANWSFLAAGVGVGILIDISRRMWAQTRRERIPISMPKEGEIDRKRGTVSGWRWHMLTTAPVLSSEPNVFISYSRASPWGAATAAALHAAIKAADIPCFLDVEGIAEGTSWSHKLQRVIGKASVFISVQDALTASRYWPCAELYAAIQSQEYCGLPSIIILRDATLANETRTTVQVSLLDTLLSQKGVVDPTLLRIIDAKLDTPKHLAQGLTGFRPASVVNPTLGVLLMNALVPVKIILASLGAVGPTVAWIMGIAWFACYALGINVARWLNTSRLGLPFMLLVSLWIGFNIRLVFASRFELRATEAPQVFWFHLGAILFFVGMLWSIVPAQAPLAIVFALMTAGFGFISACDFISITLEASGKRRPSPV